MPRQIVRNSNINLRPSSIVYSMVERYVRNKTKHHSSSLPLRSVLTVFYFRNIIDNQFYCHHLSSIFEKKNIRKIKKWLVFNNKQLSPFITFWLRKTLHLIAFIIANVYCVCFKWRVRFIIFDRSWIFIIFQFEFSVKKYRLRPK